MFFISFLIQKKIPNLMKRKKNSLSNLVYVFDNVMIHTKFLFTNAICIHTHFEKVTPPRYN